MTIDQFNRRSFLAGAAFNATEQMAAQFLRN